VLGSFPYQQACPHSRHASDHSPNEFTSLSTTAKISPFNGDLSVSLVVPGTT